MEFLPISFWFSRSGVFRKTSGVNKCPCRGAYYAHICTYLYFAEAAPSLQMQLQLQMPLCSADQCCNDAVTWPSWLNVLSVDPHGGCTRCLPWWALPVGSPARHHNCVHSAKRPAQPHSLASRSKTSVSFVSPSSLGWSICDRISLRPWNSLWCLISLSIWYSNLSLNPHLDRLDLTHKLYEAWFGIWFHL